MINQDWYYQMLRVRMVEEEIARRYPEGKMRCPVHLSVGQEAAAVGICAALKPGDKMVSTHRGHAHYLAKGGSLKGLIGELYGKSTGCSRGNGGSMHLIDLSCGFYGSTSIVGGTIPVGVGLAWADRLKGSQATTVVCIGDAAVEEGVFHESANFAGLHKLNVIFACENNKYSCYTPLKNRQPSRDTYPYEFDHLAKHHGLRYIPAPGNDLEKIQRQIYPGMGPVFLEMPTYRHLQHCGPDNDDQLGYRPKDEIAAWRERDPVRILQHEWTERIQAEIDEAFAFTEAAPCPSVDEIGKYVYA